MAPPVMPPWKDEDEDPPRPEDLEGTHHHTCCSRTFLTLQVLASLRGFYYSVHDIAEEQAAVEVAAPAKMAHDDVIGESIDEHEASQVRSAACICLGLVLKRFEL